MIELSIVLASSENTAQSTPTNPSKYYSSLRESVLAVAGPLLSPAATCLALLSLHLSRSPLPDCPFPHPRLGGADPSLRFPRPAPCPLPLGCSILCPSVPSSPGFARSPRPLLHDLSERPTVITMAQYFFDLLYNFTDCMCCFPSTPQLKINNRSFKLLRLLGEVRPAL